MAKAAAVAAAYPGPGAIVDLVRAKGDKGAIKALAAVECGTRKLGPAAAGRIVEVFAHEQKDAPPI